MKTGIIDVGGGFRGAYACGVLDYCMDEDLRFDLAVGVSAGSANLAPYIARQRGRNYWFYTDFGLRKEYAGFGKFLKKRSFIDLDYVYGVLSDSDGECPLDYPALRDDPTELFVVASNAVTGETKYFNKSDMAQDSYAIFKASSAIPFVCRPYEVYGEPYYDGALGDPVPVDKAFSEGCDRVVLLLTRPVEEPRDSKQDERFAARIEKEFPLAAENLRNRAKK